MATYEVEIIFIFNVVGDMRSNLAHRTHELKLVGECSALNIFVKFDHKSRLTVLKRNGQTFTQYYKEINYNQNNK